MVVVDIIEIGDILNCIVQWVFSLDVVDFDLKYMFFQISDVVLIWYDLDCELESGFEKLDYYIVW